MLMKKINLSNRAINLLKSDNRQRFKGYVLGEWESDFKSYFAIGACFALCMEHWAKYWITNANQFIANMEKDFNENETTEEELANAVLAIQEALNNFEVLQLPQPLEAEKEVIVELSEKYNLKCKFDAFYWDYILDHKTVSSFTKPEETEEKYGQQMKLYQYAWWKTTGEKLPAYIQEIKKARPSIPAELKKEDLLALVPAEKHEELTTVVALKDYLRIHPLPERCGQRIEFAWRDELIAECEDLLHRAMKKADYLQTLTLEDVL